MSFFDDIGSFVSQNLDSAVRDVAHVATQVVHAPIVGNLVGGAANAVGLGGIYNSAVNVLDNTANHGLNLSGVVGGALSGFMPSGGTRSGTSAPSAVTASPQIIADGYNPSVVNYSVVTDPSAKSVDPWYTKTWTWLKANWYVPAVVVVVPFGWLIFAKYFKKSKIRTYGRK